MHKKVYDKAEIEVLFFGKKDVITASGEIPPVNDDPNNPGIETADYISVENLPVGQ